MSKPTKGGRYTRDPETGELTKVGAPATDPVPAPSTETSATAEKPASAKRGRNV